MPKNQHEQITIELQRCCVAMGMTQDRLVQHYRNDAPKPGDVTVDICSVRDNGVLTQVLKPLNVPRLYVLRKWTDGDRHTEVVELG